MTSSLSGLRKNLFQPLYGFLTRSPRLRYWRELERTQYLPEEQLREIQQQRLQQMMRFCFEHNDFYRQRFQQAGVDPNAIRTPADLTLLPILTKAEIRAQTPQMISRGYALESLQGAKTGGSTGKALDLYFTEECSELRNACARRADLWTGWVPGEPIAACWGNPHLPTTLKAKLKEQLLQPLIYLDTMCVNEEAVKVFAEQWRQARPTLLYGHAHSLYILAQSLQNLGISDLRPRGILSTSMMLIPSERKVIEAVFGVGVLDRYGCEEVSLIGCECEHHQGLHLNIEHLVIEFLDDQDQPVPMGTPGRIVVTDLMNKAMPLIRYQVEDVGVPSVKTCTCGRGLPLMESVTGRVADFLVKPDGSKVAGVSLIENTLTHFPGLDQMQIVQEDQCTLHIRLVPGVEFSPQVLEQLLDYFKQVFGTGMVIEFSFVKEILPEPSGKYRFSICKVG